MVNMQSVIDKVEALTAVSEEDESRMAEICESVINMLLPRLKADVTCSDPQFIYAAAALTVYRLALLKSCDADAYDSLKTGDVTITRSNASLLESAEKLVADAFKGADCFSDAGFIFKGI